MEGSIVNCYWNNEGNYSSEKSYYWLIYDGLKNIISMNPYDHLESEQMRRD